MKLKVTIFSLFMLLTTAIFANEISKDLAKIVAKNCFYEQTGTKQSEIIFSEELTIYEENQVVYFVFNVKNNGFIIVAADDDVRPIIGYSSSNVYVAEYQPENVKNWMKRYSYEIIKIRENNIEGSSQVVAEWDKYKSNSDSFIPKKNSKAVTPLTDDIKWNQDAGWNSACPVDATGPGGHVYAGCVATAMSIIMKYWNFPVKGSGSHSYYASNYGTLTANFGTTTYLWSNMDNVTPNRYSALLMYHCGVATNMGYSGSGSGTYSNLVPSVLNTYFGYNPCTYRLRSSSTATQWQTFLKTDLDASKPVYYSGRDVDDGGHAFVCDGYDETIGNDYFHINYGWGGSSNGFYYLELSTSFEFYYQQGCITGIIPSTTLPLAPQNVTAVLDTISELGNFKVDLAWQAPSPATGLTGYKIYRGSEMISQVLSSANTYTDDALVYGASDYYGVSAVYTNTESITGSSFVTGDYTVIFKIYDAITLLPITGALGSATINFADVSQITAYGLTTFYSVPYGPNYEYEIIHPDYNITTGIIPIVYKNATYKIYLSNVSNITNQNISKISVYPNPSHGFYTINTDEIILNVDVYNISGQLVKNYKNSNTIDISDFSDGIYYIQITTDKNVTFSKIIKN